MTSGKYGFVIMIQDRWWQEFLRKRNSGARILSYVRTGAAAPDEASMLLFYVTKPVGELAGHAEFIERKVGEPEEMWKDYGQESILNSKQQYEQFLQEQRKVSFIRFKDLREASKPIPLSNLRMLLGQRRLSRKGFYLGKGTTDELILLME
jgi:predicted transcriptional regulator